MINGYGAEIVFQPDQDRSERWVGVVAAEDDPGSVGAECGHRHYTKYRARECARLLKVRMDKNHQETT